MAIGGDVTLTAALRSNLLSLQNTQKLLDSTQLKLATGRKVNSALDDANAFFGAQSLNNRSKDLNRLLDSMGQSIQTLKAADKGISALTRLVEQAQAIATEARDQASGSAVIASDDIPATNLSDLTTVAGIVAGDQFSLQAGTGEPIVTFTITAGMSAADLVNQINSTAGFAAQLVAPASATPTTSRRIEIRTTNGEDIISTDVTGTPLASLDGLVAGGSVGTFPGTTGAIGQVPVDRVQLEGDFNVILTQIDQLVDDTGYRGTNLLNGDSLTVQFNEFNSSLLNIAGVNFDSAGLNITAPQFDSDANITNTLDQLQAALDTIRAQARTFGANLNVIQTREDFTKEMTNVLTEGADKLTLADQNEEGAKLLALQTAQQLGITSLSLASQAQQSVLRLF